jgi:hypothetical protein
MVSISQYTKSLDTLSTILLDKQSQNTIKKGREKLCYTLGNTKISKDTLIINLGSASYCPSARLGLCDLAPKRFGGNGKCYALKSERMYPSSKAFRAIQYFQWKNFSPEEIADQIFKEILRTSKLKRKENRIKFIRLNESGDFHSADQVKKVDKVLRLINEFCDVYQLPFIKLYTYSHRSDLFTGEMGKVLLGSLSPNFTINGSNFMAHNNFKVEKITRGERDKREHGKKVNKFTCLVDCTKCSLCKSQTGITILQAQH